jgi:tight adherence protein B
MSPLMISLLAFVGVAALAGAAAVVFRDFVGTKAEERLDAFTGRSGSKSKVVRSEALSDSIKMTPGFVQETMGRIGNFSVLFEQAETTIGPNQFLIGTIVLAVGGATLSWWYNAPIALVPVVGIVFGTLPLLWLLLKRRKRLKVLAAQLPDALELVARALRAGHSLAAGMHVVSEEMPSPIATEFGRVYEEQNLGIPLEDALRSLAHRVPNLDLKFFVTAVQLQRQTGGDLAEILDKISYVVRERFKIFGQVQALTAEGRLSGIVLLALPPLIFFAVGYLNPGYVNLLFTETMGRQMLAGAIIMQIVGALVIKKIVNIKV